MGIGIPPFVVDIIKVLVRAAVVALASYLAGHANLKLTEDQITQIVTYLVPVLVMLGWSIYSKYHGRLKLLTAASAAARSEHEIEQMVKDPEVPNPAINTPKDEIPA